MGIGGYAPALTAARRSPVLETFVPIQLSAVLRKGRYQRHVLPTPNACVYGHWCHASMFRRRCKAAYTMHWNDILGLRQGCRAVSVRARTLGGSGTAVAGLFCCFRAALAISNGRVRCMVNRRYYVSNAHSQRCRFAPRRGDSTSSLRAPRCACMHAPARAAPRARRRGPLAAAAPATRILSLSHPNRP